MREDERGPDQAEEVNEAVNKKMITDQWPARVGVRQQWTADGEEGKRNCRARPWARADASFKSQPNSLQRSNNSRDNDNDVALVARKRIAWYFLAGGVFFLPWSFAVALPLAGRLPRFGDAKTASLLWMTNNTSSSHNFSTLFLPEQHHRQKPEGRMMVVGMRGEWLPSDA